MLDGLRLVVVLDDDVGPQGGALNEPGGNMYSHGIATIALGEWASGPAADAVIDRATASGARTLDVRTLGADPSCCGWRWPASASAARSVGSTRRASG